MSELALKLIAENKAKHARGEDARVLDLGNCGLTEVPEEVGELVWLEELILRDNKQLANIDPVKKLLALKYLNCAYTKIEDLSPISDLENLEKLEVHDSRVSHLTPLSKLEKLLKINLYGTRVKDLSPILFLLKKGLYPKVGKWGYYHTISIDDNVEIPPIDIIRNGKKAVLNWFTERDQKLQSKNTEIKLILVGNSTAGKTSLSEYLRNRTFKLGQFTTEGIIGNTMWQPKGREIQVNLWDFGGQEYYHATHRLFLSRNAIYALVWDKETDKGGFCETTIHFENDPEPSTLKLEHFPQKWWLHNIRHYTRESNPPVPVLLVQNKSARDGVKRVSGEFEQRPFELLSEWLDNHIDLEATAKEQANGEIDGDWSIEFKRFEKRLLKALESQLAAYEFAVYHRDIRDKVRSLAAEGVNDMSWTDFEQMCRDIEADAKMDLVQIYLRDITGDILYYPKNERLRERVFLRPAWVCNSIYQILSRQVQERNGLFGLDWVCAALRCDEGNALDFVALMREFELVFEYPKEQEDEAQQWVAPQYLPENCPEPQELAATKKRMKLVHGFTVWFTGFLPKSHIARFVANWGNQAKDRLFWKNGLLFETKDCTVLVERISEDKIRVDIQPHHPKQQEVLFDVFQSFLKLEDGQAGFALSFNEQDFVWWRDAQDAIHTQARQVKTLPSESAKYIDIQPFAIFLKPAMSTKKVFISYSHKDEDAMKELDKFLGPLERKGDISIWTDRKILPGQNWKAEILGELESADLTLLLVSANFLDSNFINDEEIPRAFQRMNDHGKPVIPIILNHCLWDLTDIGTLQATPKDGRPIADFPNPAQAWSEVARAVLAVLKT
jgi:internalin A